MLHLLNAYENDMAFYYLFIDLFRFYSFISISFYVNRNPIKEKHWSIDIQFTFGYL